MPDPGNDLKLMGATKHYRLVRFCRASPPVGHLLRPWTVPASSSLNKTILILLCVPMFLSPFLTWGTGFACVVISSYCATRIW
jgi:hypothetical protein